MTTEITTAAANTELAQGQTAKAALGFDTTTREGKVRLFNALNSAESLNDSNLTQLTLKGIVVEKGERTDTVTGEVVPCKFTTFITESGAYFSQSDGIADSAENLLRAFGDTLADDELTIEFYSVKLPGGRSLKKFRLI